VSIKKEQQWNNGTKAAASLHFVPLLISSVPAAGIASLAEVDPQACPHRVARVRISERMPLSPHPA
jgi:hypothetical protein